MTLFSPLLLVLLVAVSPTRAEPIPQQINAVVALSYGLAVQKHCRAQGFRVDPDAWNKLYDRLGLDQRFSDYEPGGQYAHLAEITMGSKAVSFARYPRGGCENSVDWARRFYPDLAPRLISPPKAY